MSSLPQGASVLSKERQSTTKQVQDTSRTLHWEAALILRYTQWLIPKNDKICFPKHSQHKSAEWCHLTLMHPGEQRLEFTIAQHHTWIGLRAECTHACNRCENCAVSKKRDTKCGMLPPEPTPEIIPWHTLCIDLIGPYKFSNPEKPKTCIELHCVTMADPATWFFETVEIGEKTTDTMANWLELHWLSQCPWPKEFTMDEGEEFAREGSETLTNEHDIDSKIVTSRNPQTGFAVHKSKTNGIWTPSLVSKAFWRHVRKPWILWCTAHHTKFCWKRIKDSSPSP